uniref:STI1 domain-containing protein n=1 Tax=Romanomermis culicivorax TaxID=13658 RepID=A0A915HI21_ROMCU
MLQKEYVALLRQFVDLCSKQPEALHSPELQFFRDFIENLGAKIPPMKSDEANKGQSEKCTASEPAVEEQEIESDIEFDDAGVIEPDTAIDLPMGDESVEVTEDMIEKSNDKRSEAVAAFSEGKYDTALKCFTEAIILNPGSALLHAKRASVLLQLNKPNAAIRDCDKALSINADSAQAYKYRGRAHRLLGNWEKAHLDLATACKIDYDDEANAWLKEIDPNYKKLYEHRRKMERQREEKEEKNREQRRQKAQEAYEKAKHEHTSEECCGGDDCGDLGGFTDMFKDPELMAAFQDPEIMQAFSDVSQNPMNVGKYKNNPKISKVLAKLAAKMGQGGGMPGAFFNQAGSTPSGPTPQAPKPDLDID